MDITLRASLLVVTKSADTLEVPLPAGYVAELDKARSIVAAAAEQFHTVSADQLNFAVLNAIEAGRDHHADKVVQRLTIDRSLAAGGIEIAARQRGDEITQAALTNYADAILTTWADALAPHSEALAAAADALPSHNLRDMGQVATLDVQGMQHLSNAQIAVKMWAAAVQGFGALANAAGINHRGHTRPLILTPDIAIPAFAAIRDDAIRNRAEVTPWQLAQHGIPTELATITSYAERVARYEQQRETVQRDLAEQRRVAGFGAIPA